MVVVLSCRALVVVDGGRLTLERCVIEGQTWDGIKAEEVSITDDVEAVVSPAKATFPDVGDGRLLHPAVMMGGCTAYPVENEDDLDLHEGPFLGGLLIVQSGGLAHLSSCRCVVFSSV